MTMENSKRIWLDPSVHGVDNVCHYCFEPVALKMARKKYEKDYVVEEENPLISVYIPTYNRGELLLQRSVPSVLSQTYKNFELIIIGDHCTDNTENLVSSIKDPRIRFYNLPTRGYRYPPTAENHWLAGPVVASNQALDMVQGKWIARVDDDDVWTPDHLEKLLRFAQKGNYEFVAAAYTRKKNEKWEIVEDDRADGKYYCPNRLCNTVCEGFGPKIGGTSTWLYRSYLKFFKYNINCWRKSWNRVNDTDLSQRIFRAGVRIGYLPESLAFVLPRPGEELVGLEAYQKASEKKEEHYKFDK